MSLSTSPAPSKQCLQRLQKELRALRADPNPLFVAAPEENNMLSWLVVINGPADTIYAGGRYLAEVKFSADYPFKPPTISMLTPSGRFKTNTPICMSNTSYHPESWSPLWSLSTILTGFISFFTSTERTSGSMEVSPSACEWHRDMSRKFNVEGLGVRYRAVLPEEYAADMERLRTDAAKSAVRVSGSDGNSSSVCGGWLRSVLLTMCVLVLASVCVRGVLPF